MNRYSILIAIAIAALRCTPGNTKLQQYVVQGEGLYIKYCSNCHQSSGKGLGLVYPPLDVSDFVDAKRKEVICLIRNGIRGEVIVNGNSFNQAMPALPQLTDLEIAEITTYLYNSWGRERGIVEVNEVAKIFEDCK